jgi:hypothetical protein
MAYDSLWPSGRGLFAFYPPTRKAFMNLNPRNLHVEVDENEADAVHDRLKELFDADDTPVVAFMWDDKAECWLGVAMWGDGDDESGVNFTVDPQTGALVTGIYVALKEAARE